jgi:hypothetical protein
MALTFRRCALLCVILGAHLLLLSLISLNDNTRGVRTSGDSRGILFFVELPEPVDTRSSTHSSSMRPLPTYDVSSITPPPGIEATGPAVDWQAEASRVAADVARRMGEEKKELRSLDSHPAGMGPLPPKSSVQQVGDSLHLEGGVIIDWVKDGCYYSNQDAHIDAFGPALRLQLPTCGAAGGRREKEPLPTFEEWKKERDER